MRELFPLVVKRQREQISLSAPHSSFSIHTTKKFPFFHVVKSYRYAMTATISNISRKQHGPLLQRHGRRFVFLHSVKASLCSLPQVRGRECLLLRSEAERLQHRRHAGSRRLRTSRAGTVCDQSHYIRSMTLHQSPIRLKPD